MSHSMFTRLHPVLLFLGVIAVIHLGHSQAAYADSGPSGFTRIARDLGRKFSIDSPVL
jgi:hypothetical protein